jgi:hypothetical protein
MYKVRYLSLPLFHLLLSPILSLHRFQFVVFCTLIGITLIACFLTKAPLLRSEDRSCIPAFLQSRFRKLGPLSMPTLGYPALTDDNQRASSTQPMLTGLLPRIDAIHPIFGARPIDYASRV